MLTQQCVLAHPAYELILQLKQNLICNTTQVITLGDTRCMQRYYTEHSRIRTLLCARKRIQVYIRSFMSIRNQLEPELLEYIDQVLEVCSSRAVYVINHILEHGYITSEHIRNQGYVHGARAVGDVRDNGVPLNTHNTKSSDNRTIAEYTFGSAAEIKRHKFGGRVNFPTKLKGLLIARDGLICSISQQELPENELQIDHRVPYYISGDIQGERNPDDFMLLSKSMQRAKSWDCEHCQNLLENFDVEICKTCYWAYPKSYKHVAMKEMRSINITWEGSEVAEFDRMDQACKENGKTVQDYLKSIVTENF